MKKQILSLGVVLLACLGSSRAQQTVAYDFNMTDCSGNMHHLFSELDSGNVVIMEYFMLSCSPCIDAGDALEPMFLNLKNTCSNKIKFYHFGYTNSYNCTQIVNWVNTNGYSSVPFDSGAVQTAYYGGMGMPTVAIAAGNTHKILFTSVGFLPSDTAIVADSIRTFFGCNTTAIGDDENSGTIRIYPNPSADGIFRLPQPERIMNLEVQDLSGRKMNRFRFDPVSGLLYLEAEPGLYILRGDLAGRPFSQSITIIR